MHKKNFLISIVVFSILLFCTSIIKNKTRIIEKNIFEHNLIISVIVYSFWRECFKEWTLLVN